MLTLKSLSERYAKESMRTENISDYPKLYESSEIYLLLKTAWKDGHIDGMRESIMKEQSQKINLERVYSFHQNAIKLIERAMKELES